MLGGIGIAFGVFEVMEHIVTARKMTFCVSSM